jgi:peptidoglycan hydrolase CwlO-like protein
MGLFRKKQKTMDFTNVPVQNIARKQFKITNGNIDLRGQQIQEENEVVDFSKQTNSENNSVMDFLGNSNNFSNSSNPVTQVSEISELKHKLRDMTGRLENSENDVYRLKQKLELIERKIERFENRGNY